MRQLVEKVLPIREVNEFVISEGDGVSRPDDGDSRRRPKANNESLALDPSVPGWVPLPVDAAKHLKDSAERRKRYEKGLCAPPLFHFVVRDGKISRER